MPYANEGTLTTDKREVAISETWDSQAEWEDYQSIQNLEITNGVITLVESSIPTDGLVHEWLINETSGTTVEDTVGNNDWSLNGVALSADSGYYEGAYADFDGLDDSANIDTMDFVSVNDSFSIVIGLTARETSSSTVLNHELTTSDRITMGARDGKISAGMYDGSSWVNRGGYNVSTPTGRNLLTLTWDGNSGGVYLNDSTTPDDATANPPSSSNDTGVIIGDYLSGGEDWNGRVDLMLIYNRRLSENEISTIYGSWL